MTVLDTPARPRAWVADPRTAEILAALHGEPRGPVGPLFMAPTRPVGGRAVRRPLRGVVRGLLHRPTGRRAAR
jgi:hypothetical protein